MFKYLNNPRLRFVDTPEEGGGSEADDAPEAPAERAEQAADDRGFPADTPLAEMTTEQQVAYWKHQSRKHEKRARPTNFDEIVEKARQFDELAEKNKTPDQKALDAVAAQAAAEASAKFGEIAVRAQIHAFRPTLTSEELDELLEDVDVRRFITDDGLDVDRIKRLADKLAAPKQENDTPPANQPVGGAALGFVLANTSAPPSGQGNSVDEVRARTVAKFQTTQAK